MTDTQSLSERLRVAELTGPDRPLLTEAADALDAHELALAVIRDSQQSLSERLREGAPTHYSTEINLRREAAAALDAKDAEIDVKDFLIAERNAEIELLKEGRTLHDELADHLEHELAAQSALIAQAAAALENAACAGVKGASEALAAIRAKEQS